MSDTCPNCGAEKSIDSCGKRVFYNCGTYICEEHKDISDLCDARKEISELKRERDKLQVKAQCLEDTIDELRGDVADLKEKLSESQETAAEYYSMLGPGAKRMLGG